MFLHFSPRSRDQLKAHVMMYHHRLPSPAPSFVSKAAPTKSAACCQAKRSVLILQAVLAAGRRRPDSARATPSVPGPGAQGLCQRARPGVACSGAASGPRPLVLGPRPGIAWGRLFHISTNPCARC